ncbi:Peptidoglycan-N-acetylglucosamine deacetylase [Mariniflexile rhizosphaerae]|uniref:polysaccharide deacetylase family protein n=1 Tax=unclassified Mariniflexile TaxID=2643887 RepID=UPI000CBE1190|nr:polysaccharide deacetylase family protein [Mariniflexile sp. TRM1-10]AXP81028.1 Peptidoglycan-N-acetylglucosamine deacetylase [Mariniflexile sp. TRM1-10]PLB19890.1 MAG: Polysaccharide deacetylase [Flavobacteriaceae bacterium FS1-H7996/R]
MTLTPVKTPLVAKKMFPNYVWDIPTNDKVLYLTFDDGPTPEITNWTLNTLKEYNAKATFFCIGNNIEKHPEIFQNILNEGHAIGNHTNNHIKGWKTKAKDYIENTLEAENIITNQIQDSEFRVQNFFRPPYGQITPKQGNKLLELNYKIIMWDVLSFDWDKDVSKETCLKNVTSNATNGSIVVFHDSIKASKNMQYALPKVMAYYNEKGFVFKSLEF